MKITMPDVEGVDEWAVYPGYAVYAPDVENMEPVAILRPGTTVLGDDEEEAGDDR